MREVFLKVTGNFHGSRSDSKYPRLYPEQINILRESMYLIICTLNVFPIFLEALDCFAETIRHFFRCWQPRARSRADVRARLLACLPTHARAWLRLVPACNLLRGKDVSCSDLNTIPRDEFFKINVLSVVSVSSTRRLARIAYACLFAGRSVAVDASRRTHCGYSRIFLSG